MPLGPFFLDDGLEAFGRICSSFSRLSYSISIYSLRVNPVTSLGFLVYRHEKGLERMAACLHCSLMHSLDSTICHSPSNIIPYETNDLQHFSSFQKDGEFAWDEYKQGIILGSFFWGYVLTQIPGGRLAELFGGRKLLGYGILSTSIFTLLTPFAARASDTLLIFCRVLMGLGEVLLYYYKRGCWRTTHEYRHAALRILRNKTSSLKNNCLFEHPIRGLPFLLCMLC